MTKVPERSAKALAERAGSSERRTAGKPKGEYAIQAVTNAMRLLEAFEVEDELGVAELSRRLDLHKNNVFRLLATLEQGGYIEQNRASERYRLGVRCLELGQAFARRRDLLRCARPILCELVDCVDETAHLGVFQDGEVVHVEGEQPRQLVVTSLRVGSRLPAYCTALGKVLLAFGEEERRTAYEREFIDAGLPARTAHSIVDRDKFFEHLRSVALQGYALDLDECEVGLHCVAAPVHEGNGILCAAVSVSGPSFRLSESRLLRDTAPVVMAAAERLSRALGAPPRRQA